jgi:HNH endonuclease
MEWLGARNVQGYGAIGIRRERVVATHILMFELMGNYIPKGWCVCHHCDNPPCCNPYHLFLGTHQDNVADRVLKDRTRHGQTHASAKLTDEDVIWIRNSDLSQAAIAAEFGIDQSNVSYIKRRKTWRHIP